MEHKRNAIPIGVQQKGSTFASRVIQLMGDKTGRAFARDTGIAYSSLHKYITGVGQPTLDNLLRLATKTNTNIEWLATGKGKANVVIEADIKEDIDIDKNKELKNKLLEELTGYLKRLSNEDLETVIEQVVNDGIKSLIKNEQTQHSQAIADLILTLCPEDQKEILSYIQTKKLSSIIDNTIARKKA